MLPHLRLIHVGVALALAPSAFAAPETPAPLPGGAYDSRFPGIDVYLAEPARPTRPAGNACIAAEAYVDRINAGRFGEIADLFAPDGDLFHGPGHLHRGTAAIRTFFEDTIGKQKPSIAAVGYLGGGRECAVELASKSVAEGKPRFVLVSVDWFTVGADGKVTRMIAFGRQREVPPKPQP